MIYMGLLGETVWTVKLITSENSGSNAFTAKATAGSSSVAGSMRRALVGIA